MALLLAIRLKFSINHGPLGALGPFWCGGALFDIRAKNCPPISRVNLRAANLWGSNCKCVIDSLCMGIGMCALRFFSLGLFLLYCQRMWGFRVGMVIVLNLMNDFFQLIAASMLTIWWISSNLRNNFHKWNNKKFTHEWIKYMVIIMLITVILW